MKSGQESGPAVPEWTTAQLAAELQRGGCVILDVRSREQFSGSRIETNVPLTNIPYSEIISRGQRSDPTESVVASAEHHLFDELPKEVPIATICSKGRSSLPITAGLRQLGYNAVSIVGGMEAWGNFYETHPVVENAQLGIYQISRPARGCLSYLVRSGREAVVIDPARHTTQYIELATKLGAEITMVLETHGHADHISGGPTLAREANAQYRFHPYDGVHPFDLIPAQTNYEPIWNGQEITVGSVKLKALHMPGHTLGNLVFLVGNEYLFAGDTVFISSIARPDLGNRGASWAELHHRSLNELLALPDSVLVMPGHFGSPNERDSSGLYAAKLGALKQSNRDLQLVQKGRQTFVEDVLKKLVDFPERYIEIKRVNAGLVTVDESRAAELEMGKNLCAVSPAGTPSRN